MGPWWGEASADVELGPRSGQGLNGGAGLQVGVHVGGFIPQTFLRVARFNGGYYSTLGFAVRFELRPGVPGT